MSMEPATADLQTWDQDEGHSYDGDYDALNDLHSDLIEEAAPIGVRHVSSVHGSPTPPHRWMDVSWHTEQLEITSDSLSATLSPSVDARLTGPIQLINKILETWRLDKANAVPLLGLEPPDQGYAADVLAGRTALRGRDAKDRLAYLIQMRMALSEWFRDEEVENEWLREPHEPLDGKVPMQLLLEGSMENLLLVREYIEAATGW